MIKNVKTDFEKKLKAYLADRFAEQKDIKVLKNEILIEAENGQGIIRFRYLRNLQAIICQKVYLCQLFKISLKRRPLLINQILGQILYW